MLQISMLTRPKFHLLAAFGTGDWMTFGTLQHLAPKSTPLGDPVTFPNSCNVIERGKVPV